MSERRSPDTPFLGGQGDSFGTAEEHRDIVFRAEPSVRGLALDALRAMSGSGDEAEANYQSALSALRERPEEAVAAIGATYDSLEEEQYLERWSMVQLLTDLRMSQSVEVLEDVLRQPIPPERSRDPAHGVSTVGEEVMIRTTAVEALVRLLADGDQAAGRSLLEYTRHEAISVRRAAVQGLIASGDRTLAQQVEEAVKGTDDEWMLGVRRMDVREVPQADGRQYLRPSTAEGDSMPPEPLTR